MAIPVTILTGFLGAGKTTVLNHILNADHGLRVAVLVNDFGAINIDTQLVVTVDEDEDARTIELSNGCICCTIRGDLLAALRGLITREQPPEYVIIEASGVSDPLEIAMVFKNPDLKDDITVDSVLTVVDAEQVRDLQKQDEMLAVLQVGAADIVVLNKVDLVSEQTLVEVKEWIRSIIPNARIIETTYGHLPLELVIGVGAFSPEKLLTRQPADVHVHGDEDEHDHAHTHDHALVYHTWHWTTDEPLSLRALERAVKGLPATVYRAKGLVYLADSPERAAVLQVVGKRASVTAGDLWGAHKPRTQIVVIGEAGGVDGDTLETLFEGCLARNAPSNEITRLTQAVFNWIRGR